LPKLNFQPS
jgi:hypothetical protein